MKKKHVAISVFILYLSFLCVEECAGISINTWGSDYWKTWIWI